MQITAEQANRIHEFIQVLKVKMLALNEVTEAGDAEEVQRLALQAAESMLAWNPIEHAAMTMALAVEAAILEAENTRLETKVKELEEVIASWNSPGQLPDNETTRKIGDFLAHPETGVRRERPANRVPNNPFALGGPHV